jgi:nucleoside-diphosphate-sugar epimerase
VTHQKTERFLVTGSAGCIGAWAVRQLVDQEAPVVGFDASENRQRLRLLLSDAALDRVVLKQGDIRKLADLAEVIEKEKITHIVHLAALQVPFCRSDPILGSEVNVTGVVNVLEAARRSDGQIRGMSLASSVAVFGPASEYPGGVADDMSPQKPVTLYGAYKQANEQCARIYANDWGIGSVSLRPSVIYGPGRDQGITSDPTVAMLAAAAGKPMHIGFGGTATYQHAQDAASYFVQAARLEANGAQVYNLPGPTAPISEIAAMIEDAGDLPPGSLTWDSGLLPLPSHIEGGRLEAAMPEVKQRSLREGIAETIEDFRRLLGSGRLQPPASLG